MTPHAPPASAHARKVYLTLDTDWCAEEILQEALELFQAHDLPCTLFVTGPYAAAKQTGGAPLEIGLHPNFNDTTITGYEDKLRELRALHPHVPGVASHAMMCSTPLLNLFVRYGLKYDRNLLRFKEAWATPYRHCNGLLRLPIFWEDDIWFTLEPGARFSPQLLPAAPQPFRLIFTFHPVHLFANTESMAHYQIFKPLQHQPQLLAAHRSPAYGVRSFFMDLVAFLREERLATGLLEEFLGT